MTRADRLEQGPRASPEQCDQDQILLRGSQPFRPFGHVRDGGARPPGTRRLPSNPTVRITPDRSAQASRRSRRRRADGTGRSRSRSGCAMQHVQNRLLREDLARSARPAVASPPPARTRPSSSSVSSSRSLAPAPQVHVERGDEAGRKVVFGGAHGDPRSSAERSARRRCDSSIRSAASQRRAMSTPVSRPRPCSASTSDSPETR